MLSRSHLFEYIDKLLRDMDEQGIQADGSTELDRLVKLGLGGWREKTAYWQLDAWERSNDRL